MIAYSFQRFSASPYFEIDTGQSNLISADQADYMRKEL